MNCSLLIFELHVNQTKAAKVILYVCHVAFVYVHQTISYNCMNVYSL